MKASIAAGVQFTMSGGTVLGVAVGEAVGCCAWAVFVRAWSCGMGPLSARARNGCVAGQAGDFARISGYDSGMTTQRAAARLVRFPRMEVVLAVAQLPLLIAAVIVAIMQRWETLGMIAGGYVV